MALVLHAQTTNKNAYKALIAAKYSDVNVKLVENFEMGVSNKTPEFLKMNPLGKVPVLETPDGPIFESNAIARYVTRQKENNPLYGCTLIEYAQIEQWIDFTSLEVDPHIAHWFYPRFVGYAIYHPQAEEAAIAGLKRALGALNTHLASNTFLVGHAVTLADVIMTCNLYVGFSHIMTKTFTSEFPHVERYFWTMVNQPNVNTVLGEVKQTESVIPISSAKKAAPAKAKPKSEPKKEQPKPKVEDAAEEEEAPKPKPKNPLDLLPPSKMILDEWKRLYSNTKTNFREVAIKGFWDMYDPEGYSLWFCDYKYNDENTVSFVTLNKVGGFLQRMDLARKYAFGKMLVIGSEGPYKVKGLWLFRGQEIPQFIIDECYDMELYEWTKVDLSDEAQKERVNQMIEDQEPFEGEVLHAGSTNKNAYKALIAAKYSDVNVKLVENFEMGVSNKTPEFLKMNPMGKVPVLETPDGCIFESNAIARYVTRQKENNPLYGCSLIEYAQIEQWIDFASLEVDTYISRWFYPRVGYTIYLPPPAEEAAIAGLKRALGALNTHLSSNTFLVGHAVTLADIIMTCNLYPGFCNVITKNFSSEFPHVERYFWTMVNQPNVSTVLGEVKQAESVVPISSAKKAVPAKVSAKAKPKSEPKKEQPKVEEPAEEEEAPKPKPKNPLDLLPPSKMILDEWKRLYSNTKTNFREVAIKGFWDMYDPEGYSLWFCDYKYNDENTVSFVTLNKVGGFLQRMDLARKYAFGKMLVIGSEGPYKVKGLWLFRGQEIPQFIIDECYDMELYEWTKVDLSDEAQKERVNQMIEDQEPFEGEALLDAKCFK
ncbi:Elongation factor 1-gamma [Thalictrum thalictroides]|uniref:Elongation factor 1-gamma n=1 Tax=Thalictrum thalictroides TaxID=46969 RepID=A0A7J6W4L8_THATH|nr:Elongation factor 1-gamma [Thalictrum thalictroides]